MKLFIIAIIAAVLVCFAGVATAGTAQVLIKDMQFQPASITVSQGDTVTWTNADAAGHTVRFADAESQVMKNGGTYSRTFSQPGTFDYICGIHPNMKGSVTAM